MHADYLNKDEFRFYEDHLKHTIIDFWMPRCMDEEYCGYLNCYDIRGEKLMSKDKFIWSQGRFVWILSKLAGTSADIFTARERARFLEMAESGVRFLRRHALIPGTMSCTYLTDQMGRPKYFGNETVYDASIYADCFVVLGLSRYAFAAGSPSEYEFSRKLFASVRKRIEEKNYRVLPFVRPEGRKMHGVPMICLNTACELYAAAVKLGFREDAEEYRVLIGGLYDEIMLHFRDENGLIHEIVPESNIFTDDLLGRHLNPGHSIEDLWFLYEAGLIAGKKDVARLCTETLLATFRRGWDGEFGGITLYADVDGGRPKGSVADSDETQDMVLRIRNNWDSKLYWVHSETLYTSLLLWKVTGDPEAGKIYEQVKDYTFAVFPNENKEIGEWIQNRTRSGQPDDKMVGLPVKDPFHIPRNLIKILELF